MEVGELISFYRKQAGMTIDELAAQSGVPKGTLNKIGGVTKAPTLDNMKSIARALGKTLADFDDTPIDTRKSPSVAEAALGGKDVLSIFNYLNEGLVSLGFIDAGSDITEQQADVLISICRILRAAFEKQ